jgi:single-strand DNA-binding protein
MNKITLIGNLTANPELRSTPSGVSVCTFTIAVNRRFANADGEKQTDFFRINAWRGLADTCARYLEKGKKVAVIGELQARTYIAKDGTNRMSLDVSADEVEFLSPKSADSATVSGGQIVSDQDNTENWPEIGSDDLPF